MGPSILLLIFYIRHTLFGIHYTVSQFSLVIQYMYLSQCHVERIGIGREREERGGVKSRYLHGQLNIFLSWRLIVA